MDKITNCFIKAGFRPMDEMDYQGFAGAAEGSFIKDDDESVEVMIWEPETKLLTITNVETGEQEQHLITQQF